MTELIIAAYLAFGLGFYVGVLPACREIEQSAPEYRRKTVILGSAIFIITLWPFCVRRNLK